jgi:copper chaperone
MAEVVKRSFKVDGMTCMGCVGTVKRVVSAVPGVQRVDVSLDRGAAEVEFDPAATGAERIVAAISNAGFDASEAASR